MIPVPHPIPEPDDFDEKCRQAGKEWLKYTCVARRYSRDVMVSGTLRGIYEIN